MLSQLGTSALDIASPVQSDPSRAQQQALPPRSHPKTFTLTEILPSSFGRWAARNQSPGSGLVTLNTPVVRLGRVQVRVSAKEPGTAVSLGKCVCSGLMTEGAPERKYLQERAVIRVQAGYHGRASMSYTWGFHAIRKHKDIMGSHL